MAFQRAEWGACPSCRRELHSEPQGDCEFSFDRRMYVWLPWGLSLKGWAIYVLIVVWCFVIADRNLLGSGVVKLVCAMVVVVSIPGVFVFLFLGRGRRYRLVLGPRGVYVLHPRKKDLFCDWASIGRVEIEGQWGHVLLQDENGGGLMVIPGSIFGSSVGALRAVETVKAIAIDGGIRPICPRCGNDLRRTAGPNCTACGTEFDPVVIADWPFLP